MYDQCNNNINTLKKRFHHEKKILMLRALVVCFSFTTLNILENKKGIIKILFYSSVIDINEMEVIFATIMTGG